jgi:catechol-2,3-dioxygenase
VIKPIGLIEGHYECRSLEDTLPIFTDLLALEVAEKKDGQATLKHPNTDWLLVVHNGGVDAADKPHNNHYGFRVENKEEVDAAWKYISKNRDKYGIRHVTKPHESHFAYSIYFKEPGGNDLEIEYYDPAALAEGRRIAAPHWNTRITEDRFPGRGYIPQAMSHGTLQCDNKKTSERFYRDVLGLEIVGGGRTSVYIRHPSTPWYIVVLPGRRRRYLSPSNRFTLRVDSPEAVEESHLKFTRSGKEIGITQLGDIERDNGKVSFAFGDMDRNWWEVSASSES